MCDTLALLGGEKGLIFAKNSDRHPGESQIVEYNKAGKHSRITKMTYTEAETSGEAAGTVISRPSWMWGAEMGFNEYGVVAGNEAVFTKRRFHRSGMTGMDLLRLGLEESRTSREMVDVMARYVENYGIDGSNGQYKEEYYDDLYLVADKNEIYVLGTFGKTCLYEKRSDMASISNVPFEFGTSGAGSNFNPRIRKIYTYLGSGRSRLSKSSEFLSQSGKNKDVEAFMSFMRSHEADPFSPARCTNADICMHSRGFTRPFQTANSMIFTIQAGRMESWITFSPNPCMSLYKPVIISNGEAVGINYGESYWKQSEAIHQSLSGISPKSYRRIGDILNGYQGDIIRLWRQSDHSNMEKTLEEIGKIDSYAIQFEKTMADNIENYR